MRLSGGDRCGAVGLDRRRYHERDEHNGHQQQPHHATAVPVAVVVSFVSLDA